MSGAFNSEPDTKRKAGLCAQPGCLRRPLPGRAYCGRCAPRGKPLLTRAELNKRHAQMLALRQSLSVGLSVDPPSFVYAIGVAGHGVKFGRSRHVAARMAVLQVGSPVPLQLFGSIAVEPVAEPAIHDWLRPERLNGEWFRHGARTQVVIDLIVSGDGAALLDHVDPTRWYRDRRK